MAEIPTISKSELIEKLNNGTRGMKSCEVVDEQGDYFATLIVPLMTGGATIFDHTRTQAEYLGVQGNSVYQEPEPEPIEVKVESNLKPKMRTHRRKKNAK